MTPAYTLPPLEVAILSHPLLAFVKAHANGNDFLILDEQVAHGQHAALARKLCQRTTSIGADGIEFLDRSREETPTLRLFNADGSEAELSGNGTRCVAAWLAATEGIESITFHTHAGPRACELIQATDPTFVIRTGMGIPRVLPRTIVLPGIGAIAGAMVNVGNPHFVLFVDPAQSADDFSAHGLAWQQLGALIAASPLFPHGTNVEFVRPIAHDEIAFRIFERGCGPTTSSGTGTSAAAAAVMALMGAPRNLIAHAEGGPQRVSWESSEAELYLTGPAEIICRGEVSGL